MKILPPYTPLLYSKTGVYRRIHFFLISALKHRLWVLVRTGVPQGSVLGPLLFLVYVNDISESILSLTRLFADDSSLFYSTTSIFDIEGIINSDLQVLTNWTKR